MYKDQLTNRELEQLIEEFNELFPQCVDVPRDFRALYIREWIETMARKKVASRTRYPQGEKKVDD